jgi:hypothetical protein
MYRKVSKSLENQGFYTLGSVEIDEESVLENRTRKEKNSTPKKSKQNRVCLLTRKRAKNGSLKE